MGVFADEGEDLPFGNMRAIGASPWKPSNRPREGESCE